MRSIRRLSCMFLLAAALVPALALVATAAPLPGGTLNPLSIAKFVDPLPIPGVMPPSAIDPAFDYYEIGLREFSQQVLSTVTTKRKPLPMTKVWGYGSLANPATFAYPSLSIEATSSRPVRVRWVNQLVKDPVACAASVDPANDPACNYLPHLLPVDQTLHWANPPQECINPMPGMPMPDCRGFSQLPYTGPVPMVPHLHGAHVEDHSDGYPTAWFLPAANNILGSYAKVGSGFAQSQIPGAADIPGEALYQYRNDQRATTLWFHDHTLGMTRTNVYAGPAGFYLVRGGADDLPSDLPGAPGGLPGGIYEIPLVIQDRSFNADGSLFYPNTRAFFDGFLGPYIGDTSNPPLLSDVAPLHNPEFFGNTIVVNGKTWPFLNVEPRKYRFRILNGSDSRFLVLALNNKNVAVTQIGSEGGFLPAPVPQAQLLIGPAERADVVVDFSKMKVGSVVTMKNLGPDSPFGGFPIAPIDQSDPSTTGQVMQFKVVALTAPDTSTIPVLPTINNIVVPANPVPRQVSLNEDMSMLVCVDAVTMAYLPGLTPPNCGPTGMAMGPISARLGTVVTDALGVKSGVPMDFMDPITEAPLPGSTEVWEINNFTVDAHPIHLHLVMFQVIDRTDMVTGVVTPAEPWETGFKDTVIAYPGQATRVKAVYDLAGLYLWHCHILSHEDNEMMRPYCVGLVDVNGNCCVGTLDAAGNCIP